MGIAGQSSFIVHIFVAVGVLGLALLLNCELWQWCILGLCIAVVMSLELINSAIEALARGLCQEQNEQVGKSLDIASGAVLLASIAAACIGIGIFVQRVLIMLAQL